MKPVLALALALALGTTARSARAEVAISDSAGSATIDCAKDPEVAVVGSSNEITLTGECTKLAISGSSNKVTAATVAKIAITGSTNEVNVDAVDKVALTGSDNKVTYKKGVTRKTPKVAKLGTGNAVKKVK